MRRTVALVAATLFFASAATWVACGGDDSVTIGGGDAGADGAAAGDDASGGGGGDGAGGGGGDTGAGGDTGGGGGGGQGGDGGGANDGGPGGTTSVIPCGSTTCSVPQTSCCVYGNQNPPPDFLFSCSGGGDAGCPRVQGADRPVALACTSGANCGAGTVCCVVDDGNGHISSSCAASCTNGGGGGGASAQLCDTSSADAGCLNGRPCSSNNIGDWNLPPGFATCGGISN